MNVLREMNLEEIAILVREELIGSENHRLPPQLIEDVDTELSSRCAFIGKIWDAADGVDPTDGPIRRYGATSNRKSKTYLLRKAAGFTYP